MKTALSCIIQSNRHGELQSFPGRICFKNCNLVPVQAKANIFSGVILVPVHKELSRFRRFELKGSRIVRGCLRAD